MRSFTRDLLMVTTMSCCVQPAMAQTPADGPAQEPSATTGATQVEAQADAQGAAEGLADIVITARRREERLQDVPVAVSVIGGGQLAEKAITKFEDVANAVPSLQVQPAAFGKSIPSYTIRSQRQGESLLSQDPSVGIYFAEVVQARPHGVNSGLFDLSSVQVLKGPQGTLFGRNSTGGAVVITPQAPRDVLEGYARATLGNYDQRVVEGMMNVPLGDKLQVRLVGQVNRRDGYVTNVRNGRDLEDEHNESWRASIRLAPVEGIENRLVLNGFNANENGSAPSLYAIGPTASAPLRAAFAAQQARDRFNVDLNDPTGSRIRSFGLSNITEIDVGALTLKNIFGYRFVRSDVRVDLDGTPLSIIAGADRLRARSYSDELQLLGKAFDDHLDFILGGYYFLEKGENEGGNVTFGTIRTLNGQARNLSRSLLAQGTLHVPGLEAVSLTGGLRQTWDNRRVTLQQNFLAPNTTSPVCFFTVNDVPAAAGGVRLNPCEVSPEPLRSDRLTYTLSADWKVATGVLLYGTHRRGYRSGGFNLRATTFAATVPFQPEDVKDYEVGLKTDWRVGDLRGRFNVAAYHQDYSEIQRITPRVDAAGNFIGSTITNAARAKIDGVEVEATIIPTRGLEIGAFYSFSNPRYTEWLIPRVEGGVVVFGDSSNAPFAAAPRHSGGGSITYTSKLRADAGEVTLSTNVYAQSSNYAADGSYDVVNQRPFLTSRLPSYVVANGRVQWDGIFGSAFSAAAYVNNMFDEHYFRGGSDLIPAGLNTAIGWVAPPRTYGVEVSFKF